MDFSAIAASEAASQPQIGDEMTLRVATSDLGDEDPFVPSVVGSYEMYHYKIAAIMSQ